MDGRVEEGAFVTPYAYEWFIEGEVAAAKGRHEDAALALETATATPAQDVVLMTRLAEEYERSGSSRRADRALAAARRLHPGSARVALAEGRIHQRRGEIDRAMRAFVEARTIDPTSDEVVIALADALRRKGLSARADAVLVEYITTNYDGHTENARRVLIQLAEANGDPDALRRALALGAGRNADREAFLAAELAYEGGQPALAARLLERTLGTPANQSLWLLAAVDSGDLEAAREFLMGAESEAVGGPVRHAELFMDVGAHDEALEILQTAGSSPRAQYVRGRALLDGGEYLSASRALAGVPAGSSKFEESRVAFATATEAQGRDGAATEALSLAPKDSLAVRTKLGELFVEQGDLRAGLRLFDPKRTGDRAAIALLFERAGRFPEAAAYYASIEESDGEGPRIHARATAERFAARGQHQPAIAILTRWAATSPEDLFARVRLTELLRLAGRLEEARTEGQAALARIDDPTLAAHLAQVLSTIDVARRPSSP